ncbi:DUF748 domain-containing protein [Nodosilinea nodulosa]|uniref:DUF748 domain-containing protein n=1 Tax=Nodosilinea nodulosa TaxID=416001 RepID=UPI0002DB60B1|nr:DUF748 domain-containing protein [Nodosilinea nodulosa]
MAASVLLGLAGALAVTVLGGTLAERSVHKQVEQTLSSALDRPVRLGRLRGVSPRGVWLGQTVIPPTEAGVFAGQAEAVVVGIDWSALWQQRALRATVTLVQPRVVAALPEDLGDLLEDASLPDSSGSSLAALAWLRVEGGRLTVRGTTADPAIAQPLTLAGIQATVHRAGGRSPVAFTVTGQINQGQIQASGTLGGVPRSLALTAQTRGLPLSSLNLLLPSVVTLRAGTLDSTLTVASAVGSGVWQVSGTAAVQGGQGALGQAQLALDRLRSRLGFEGQRITLTDTHLQIGPLSFDAAGTVDRQAGYNLAAQVAPMTAADLRGLVGDRLPIHSAQPWQGQGQITGSLQDPTVALQPSLALAPPGQFVLDLGSLALALGLHAQALPPRAWLGPIEGATYQFGRDGAWFTLSDGTVVPPLSESAYRRASGILGSDLRPALDRKFFWFLQTSPYVTAIAADLARGQLQAYRQGSRFDTDRFFLEYFVPVYAESSRAAGLDPGEALWMLDHSLRTLHDPLLRHPDARPITSGAGRVGSFWAGEQLLSMQQLLARPLLAQSGPTGQLTRLALIKQLDASTSLPSRRLSSTPELMAKIPNVTVGAEEGAIALSLGMMRFEGEGIYPEQLRSLAAAIEQNELDKHALRTTITAKMERLATEHRTDLGFALLRFTDRDWASVGLGQHLFPGGAAQLTGSNTLSVMVSRQEKAGYSLEAAYQNSRLLLLEMLAGAAQDPKGDRLLYAVLKDYAFSPRFWQILAHNEPFLAARFSAIAADTRAYQTLAQQGAALHEAFYATLITTDQDIGVSAALKQAVGFEAHLARLLDQAFAPADPADPRYRAFRRSLAIYLREAPDISVYGGSEAALRAYGQETLNVQELIAVDVADAPRIRAMVRLYHEALANGLITDWDEAGFQRILLTGALLAAGVERSALPADLQGVGFPSAEFRRDLLFVVGVEGSLVEATRLGIQAHDYRVSFQPVDLPDYRSPPLNGADPASCPSQPYIAAIALGAASSFVWDAEAQRVVLRRGSTRCPLPEDWTALFFPALLESVPLEQSQAGCDRLQASLQVAKRLEAGIF